VGEIKIIYHRIVPETAVLKHLVLKHINTKWYVCLMLELPDPEPVLPIGKTVGIDMGVKSLLATSDGVLYENPHWLRESLAQLRVAQRTVARRKKGSNRRHKAVRRVSALYEKITSQRADYWHKITRNLAEQYSFIALENLNLNFMNRNKNLSLSSYDAGLGIFTQLLAYKVEETGSRLVLVNPANTSQACSACGELVEKDLSVRVHKCPHCGLIINRDINAARNILSKAVNLHPLGLSGQDLTWNNSSCVSCEAVIL
jgi:putative transposase